MSAECAKKRAPPEKSLEFRNTPRFLSQIFRICREEDSPLMCQISFERNSRKLQVRRKICNFRFLRSIFCVQVCITSKPPKQF